MRSHRIAAFLALFCTVATAAIGTQPHPLATHAERTRFAATGRYAEVVALCSEFAKRHPGAVRCQDFGVTPEGRPLKVLVVSQAGALTPAQARKSGMPVVLVQGGIHAGEIDGKDAGFLALRQMLEGEVQRGALGKQVLLFVPVFNVDGHERFGAWNRPNQRGPRETGWRTTAQNFNLNREYMKADAPEMQAMLRLVEAWDPLLVVDLHVTDGAKFEHDIAVMVQPVNAGDEAMRQVGLALREATVAHLARNGSLPLAFYPAFIKDDDPTSGIRDGVPPPRLSHGYFWLRNRLGMLVETHSWKTYPARVEATRQVILSVVEQVAKEGRSWRRTAMEADARAAALAGEPVALTYRATDRFREVPFRGYAWTRSHSEVSGAPMTRYDENRPEVWSLKLHDEIVPGLVVKAPGAGYLVPAAHAPRARRWLDAHGIRYETLRAAIDDMDIEAFRATRATAGTASSENRQRMTLEGEWKPERRTLPAGSLFVPIAQPRSRLAMSLLEPRAPDSLAAWGEFNIAFEPREYMEAYVAEDVAREALAADPALAAEFRKRTELEPDFAGNPRARLDFFYQRHPSWDREYRLYPVVRANSRPRHP
ncbi:MAG: M14 family metallopeptidase [Lysobacter sp.]|nr:M14 family metallopeptidase [Lysobacter sp.]